MENLLLTPREFVVARNHAQQLKLMMNLPVRLISENQVLDVLPLEQLAMPMRRKPNRTLLNPLQFPTPNQLMDFFKKCKHDDLITAKEVAAIYNVTQRTIAMWAQKGLLCRYMLASGLTLYKRVELPSIEQLYGPYEL